MMGEEDDFSRIYWTGILLLMGGIFGTFFHLYLVPQSETMPKEALVFVLIVGFWNTITGIGIVARYRWGFYLFKFYLCVLYIGFPIGTYVAKKYFEYIKEHSIEKYYR
ncbi:hypothetical protein [Mariprofundus ferrooxydans]|uniref:hypothetical protein n=1 Tax=Mariprofundus ferrooxydans TaxID=314344 RepID=UPI00036A3629|nr:hypothetical protein [Mariprofundus ferrooxydans]